MASTPGGPSRRDDVLVVRGVGEKRSPGQWAVLIGVPGLLLVVGVVVVLALTRSGPQVDVQSRVPQQQAQTTGQATAPTPDAQPAAPTADTPPAAATDPNAVA
ncbi:MAG: hypothetical protein KKI08_16380, partial [Armatimonadetes bacterium]|nr:hypothetical protein [Armatimonadota bacterium]